MADEGFKRKLAAILSADVEGYSRLMDDDEEATVSTITSYRTAITDLVQQYRGRVVDSPGDNILAEFASVVDAVNCAVEIHRDLAERNAELLDKRKMFFRIGVNVGDVIEKENRIYGDGVNIAARVEGFAEAGGICVSGRVYDQVENKLNFEYEFLGNQKVKNIKRPVRIYRVLSYPGAATHRVIRAKRLLYRKWQKVTLAAVSSIIFLMVVFFLVWNNYFSLPSVTTAVAGDLKLNLPEGPSIAVLPFDNMSKDPEKEYFSDGLTENIITGLAANSNLFVIARNSSFVYKGKAVQIKQIARELGVRYILEGSVQKDNNRVRINVQLIDSLTEHHIWAEKYDRDLQNIFDLQDEITLKILTDLQVTLTEGDQARHRSKYNYNLETSLKLYRALYLLRRHNKEDNSLARQELEEIIDVTPDIAGAYILLAHTHLQDQWYGAKYPILSFAMASKAINQAFALDEKNSDAYLALSYLYMMRKQLEEAKSAAEQAIFYNRNGADAFCQLGLILYYLDKPIEAIGMYKKAMRLNPYPPAYYYNNLGYSYSALQRYDDAGQNFRKSISIEPDMLLAHIGLTITLNLMGKQKEAHEQAKEVLRLDPNFRASQSEKTSPNRNREVVKRSAEALRKAGLPD